MPPAQWATGPVVSPEKRVGDPVVGPVEGGSDGGRSWEGEADARLPAWVDREALTQHWGIGVGRTMDFCLKTWIPSKVLSPCLSPSFGQ